ncbi:MAG TPA: Fe-S cluster assembly protein HesB [Actinomycetota bacterium]|nr:Fe-S cluster assembly protein HesB [Actinomycetota bacterium]
MPTEEFALAGARGEPVDLWRTLASHGFAELPPMRLDEEARTLETTLPLARGRPRTVRIGTGPNGAGRIQVLGPVPSQASLALVRSGVLHVLRMDEDLSGFYSATAGDPDLAWISRGAGRMLRSPTVFEDVVKTICTTNCAWSATERMVGAIVEHLGERAPAAPLDGPWGRAFPSPATMAQAPESFYREVARAGYRGAYLIALARSVADGEVDLEALAADRELPDDEVERRLLALPGVGPYAAAHVMTTIGRYSRLILDSWTRPKYARLVGKKHVADRTMERRFRRYGAYAGLAFWLFLTRDWVDD